MRCFSALFFLGLVFAGCSRPPEPVSGSPGSSAAVASTGVVPSRHDFASHWQDESQYIVETIAADLAEMFRLAAGSSAEKTVPITVAAEERTGTETLTYRVTVKFGEDAVVCEVPMRTAIWDPATYAPLTAALARRQTPAASPAAASDAARPRFVEALLTPTAETLADTDIALSKELEARFTDSALHREAALLLGAFALRESSGKFHQIRDELCGMTAHLAFANQLSPADTSDLRRLAETLLTLLYNNQADALAQLSALPETDGFGPWKTALRLRATGDYRLLTDSSRATLLEIREAFRAKAGSLSAARAWDDAKLGKTVVAQADWYRILAEQNVPIRLGHLILKAGLPAQFGEMGAVFTRETGRDATQAALLKALEEPPSRFAAERADAFAPRRVIGWGRWAAAFQRQLCHLITEDFDFMENRWGVPDDAAQFREQMDKLFGHLRLYHFVRLLNSTRQDYYRAAQDDGRALLLRSPEIVPAEIWNYTCYKINGCELYIPPPHGYVNEWHLHNPPAGTAYNPLPRMNQPSLVQQSDTLAQLERLHQLAPYDNDITHNLLRIRDGEKQDPARMAEAYRDVLDFNPGPNRRIARVSESDPEEYEKWMLRAAAIDPTDLQELARYYRKHGQKQKAADTYIAWLKVETDEVAISADAEFLINYFEDNQRTREATALADRAADAYSFNGLLAKANLFERRGRFPEALAVHRKLEERYNSSAELIGFLWRVQKSKPSPRFAKEFDTAVRATLPGGLVLYKESNQPPARGVIVSEETDRLRRAGLRKNDIVVAVRGYQVESWKAFKTLRALSSREPYVMKVWRDGACVDLAALDPAERFGVDLKDYAAP